MAGRPSPSIADLLIATELEQLRLLDAAAQARACWVLPSGCWALAPLLTAGAGHGCPEHGRPATRGEPPHPPLLQGPNYEELLAPHPRVRAWLARLAADCQPAWNDAHAVLHKVRARLLARVQGSGNSRL